MTGPAYNRRIVPAERPSARATLSSFRLGRIKYREDVVRGSANAPVAFLGPLKGRNFGKLVADVAGAGA